MFKLIFLFCAVKITSCNEFYSVSSFKTTAPWIDSISTITVKKVLHQMFCLAQCNTNEFCLSLTYNSDPLASFNCILYNTYFLSNELVASNTSTLFTKKCKK